MLKKSLLITALAFSASSAFAGDFKTLTNGNGTNLTVANGGLANGTGNNAADPLYIATTSATYLAGYSDTTSFAEGGLGNVVETSISYQATGANAHTGTLNLLDWHLTTGVTLLPGQAQADVYDFVYRDSYDNKLVFGSRFLNRVDNNQEFNYTYRYGFTGFQAAAAWTYVTDGDLRLYQGARTDDHTYAASVPYDTGSIRLKGDYSVGEGNPWSALDLIKTDATSYVFGNNALGYYQAGEETQAVVGNKIAGYLPTIAAVPEANTTTMLLAGLGMMGFVARRRNQG